MRIKEQKISEFLTDLASSKPTPGGGSASALAGAMAAALVVMVANLTKKEEFTKLIKKAGKLQKDLTDLIDEDAKAFLAVMKNKNSQTAIIYAAEVPLETAQKSLEVLKMAHYAAKNGNQNCRSDALCAIELATAAIYGALENVRINLPFIKDEVVVKRLKDEIEKILADDIIKAK